MHPQLDTESTESQAQLIALLEAQTITSEQMLFLLFLSAQTGDTRTLRHIFRSSANPNVKDAYGLTPLHYAVKYGTTQAASILLEAGANIHCFTPEGQNLLQWTLQHQQYAIFKILINHGAPIYPFTLNAFYLNESILDKDKTLITQLITTTQKADAFIANTLISTGEQHEYIACRKILLNDSGHIKANLPKIRLRDICIAKTPETKALLLKVGKQQEKAQLILEHKPFFQALFARMYLNSEVAKKNSKVQHYIILCSQHKIEPHYFPPTNTLVDAMPSLHFLALALGYFNQFSGRFVHLKSNDISDFLHSFDSMYKEVAALMEKRISHGLNCYYAQKSSLTRPRSKTKNKSSTESPNRARNPFFTPLLSARKLKCKKRLKFSGEKPRITQEVFGDESDLFLTKNSGKRR